MEMLLRDEGHRREREGVVQGWTSLNKNFSWSWSFLAQIIFPELELELFSSSYSPRAGAGAFRLHFLVPELQLEFWALKFFIKLELELTSSYFLFRS